MNNKNVCAVCNEQVYKPICALCLTDRVEGWLERRRLSLVREFRGEIRKFLDNIRRYNRLKCSVCRIETDRAVCPTCFIENIVAWLAGRDKSLATDLIKTFHYDIKEERKKLEYA